MTEEKEGGEGDGKMEDGASMLLHFICSFPRQKPDIIEE
jgi:hypothetical protein